MLIRRASGRGEIRQRCAIAVMAKASIAGVTKTRLVPPLSFEQAAAMNTAFLADIADNLMQAAERAPIDAYMAFGPPGSAPFFEDHMPGAVGLIETWFPDFGACLYHAVDVLLGLGYGAACVLNSDSPTLPTSWLVETAEALARPGDRIVLGPSTDGGYYLLGMKTRHHRLFEDITWSTEHVARETRERAQELGLDTVMLPPWYDIDDAEALDTLIGETQRGERFAPDVKAHDARHSATTLRRLGLAPGFGPQLRARALRAAP
jgi:rSAM/selenodomain-associated transferase 1